MSPRERRLARLLRALIACCALLFAFAPPSFAAGAPRDTSGWIAEQVASAIVLRTAARATQTSPRSARQQSTAPAPTLAHIAPSARSRRAAPAAHRTTFDARHLYLHLLTLLC